MNKLLTVSIAAYNAEKWLSKCLDSFCIPEIMESLDVIIVNDGSSDGTSEVAKKYVTAHPGTFRLIEKENGGHGSTINASIPKAAGKYYKIVDADDWVEKYGIIDLINKLKSIDADVVYSPYYKVNADDFVKTKVFCMEKNNKIYNQIVDVDVLDPVFDIQMHALTFRTELLQKNFTPIDEHCFYVDMEYNVFYFSSANNIYISDVPIYDYLVGTNEQSVNMTNMVKRRDQHLRVCKRIFSFYGKGKRYIDRLIENCVINEYRILLEIDDSIQSKNELLQFETELKESDKKLYEFTVSNGIKDMKQTAMAIWLMRLLHFCGYRGVHKLIHIRG